MMQKLAILILSLATSLVASAEIPLDQEPAPTVIETKWNIFYKYGSYPVAVLTVACDAFLEKSPNKDQAGMRYCVVWPIEKLEE